MSGIDYRLQIKEKFKNIDLSDGVNKEEAIIIAQNYIITSNKDKIFDLKSAKIFGENDPYWPSTSWHISFNIISRDWRRRGLKWGTFHVDKKTGVTKYGGEGPS
ncbi:MAG: hypothetical protein KKF54_02795 [Candidatus Omnitrophica bacterium]|nr:hypothetical protein [Candidatus Omnitrophota bacterium]